MSWLNTVAVAISAPLEVDITAASAAASTRPASSGCSCISTNWANASSRDSSAGSRTLAAIPITAPATAYSRQYTPGRGAGPAGHAGAARGEHPLPDVLADQQPEGVDDEVGQDGAAADRGQRGGARRAASRPGRRTRRSCTTAIGSRMKKMPMVLMMNCTKSVSVIDHMPPSVE